MIYHYQYMSPTMTIAMAHTKDIKEKLLADISLLLWASSILYDSIGMVNNNYLKIRPQSKTTGPSVE